MVDGEEATVGPEPKFVRCSELMALHPLHNQRKTFYHTPEVRRMAICQVDR